VNVTFTVPAFPGEIFAGAVARIGHSIDPRTRTMPVELDVNNPSLRLAPGMLPQVSWPTRRLRPSLLVPASAVTVTTERSFVIRIWDGIAEWVDVTRDASVNQYGTDMVEVFGELAPGDRIAVRGTDELRAGTRERRAADDGGELRPIVADQADPLHVEVVHAPAPRLVPPPPGNSPESPCRSW
jgi:membrane fusion protein, multidrug efflux system